MADPRAALRYNEIGALFVTYAHDNTIVYAATAVNGSAQVGLAVSLEDDFTVTLAGDGEAVEGKLIQVEPDGYCVVQVAGYMTLPSGASATLTNGAKIVGDLDTSAEGYIRAAASGTAAELILARGRIIDNTTTSAVVVCL